MKTLPYYFFFIILIVISFGCDNKENNPTAPIFSTVENQQKYASYGVGVELLSRREYHNYVKASFSFRYATRDDSILVKNEWDILYGNDGVGNKITTFDNGTIADLGAVKFEDVVSIPLADNFSSEQMTAQLGHVYVVHVSNNEVDFYAKFIITSLIKADKITFNWVRSNDGISFNPYSFTTNVDYEQKDIVWGIGAELFSQVKHGHNKSTYSFEFDRDDTTAVYSDYDIIYDSYYIIISGDTIADYISANMGGEIRSVIADLGIVNFDSVKVVPLSADYSARSRAFNSHVYIVHTKDSDSDYYTKFIVTAMESKDWIRINWVCSSDGMTFRK